MPEMTLREFAAMGGRACQAARTPEERSEAARKAVTIRWMRAKAKQKSAKKTATAGENGNRPRKVNLVTKPRQS